MHVHIWSNDPNYLKYERKGLQVGQSDLLLKLYNLITDKGLGGTEMTHIMWGVQWYYLHTKQNKLAGR